MIMQTKTLPEGGTRAPKSKSLGDITPAEPDSPGFTEDLPKSTIGVKSNGVNKDSPGFTEDPSPNRVENAHRKIQQRIQDVESTFADLFDNNGISNEMQME